MPEKPDFSEEISSDSAVEPSFDSIPYQDVYVDKRSTREKITIGVILVVGFVAVIFGSNKLMNLAQEPLINFAKLGVGSADAGLAQNELSAVFELQNKDTDGDDLTDYAEIYIYKSSPYLEDSDSDTYGDKQEVDSGDDPNCPGTESCWRSDDLANQANISLASAQDLIAGKSNPSTIRNFLLQKGFPQDTLDSITDEQLMSVYQQALAGQEFDFSALSGSQLVTSTTTGSKTNLSLSSLADLENLTGAQIRELMIKEGAPADLLSQISDEELKQVFLDKLKSQTTK